MEHLASRLQLKELRLLLAIEKTGQLALAADQLAMTQPAASRMLAGLEKMLGAKAFIRHPKGMTPTGVGTALVRNAAVLVHDMERTVQEVEAVKIGQAGTVRVGAVTGGATAFVVPAVQALRKIAPDADIHVDVAPSDVLIDGLLKGNYDFVLSRIPAGIDPRQFNVRRGRVEVMRFLVRSGNPLAASGVLTLSDLAGFEWVIQAPGSPMRQAVEEAFITRDIPLPGRIVNTTSLLVMLAYLGSSDAVAPISREVADLFDSVGGNLKTLEINEPIIVHAYHLVSSRNRVLSPVAAQLQKLVLDVLTDLS